MQSRRGETEDRIFEDLQPVLRGLGCDVVEISIGRTTGTVHVVLIIYRESGVNIDTCALVHKTVYPRLEMLYPEINVQLEVSSPGISRVLKSPSEFEVFAGLGVMLLLDGENDWKRGIICESTVDSVDIKIDDTKETFEYDRIRKAKLDNL
jgi:ribosome maturation factor RimP